MTIRVLLADDQAMVRAGFRMILEAEDDIVVVGEANDGAAAVQAARATRPDVVLMDIQMPILDGIEATGQIGSDLPPSSTRVLVLTTFERDDYIFAALRAGASGFLLKNSSPEDLVAAVRVVAHGEALLSPSITRRIISDYASRPTPPLTSSALLAQLTHREVEVLKLMARGRSNSELAEELFVSEGTIKTHVSNILTKLDLRDRVQAVVCAYQSGLMGSGPRQQPCRDEAPSEGRLPGAPQEA